jgi:hypothetical protein
MLHVRESVLSRPEHERDWWGPMRLRGRRPNDPTWAEVFFAGPHRFAVRFRTGPLPSELEKSAPWVYDTSSIS